MRPATLIPWAAALALAFPMASPGGTTQPQLREMAASDLKTGFVTASSVKAFIVEGRYLRWTPAWAIYPDIEMVNLKAEDAIRLEILSAQCEVEAMRRDKVSPEQLAIWIPVLAKVEAVIARAIDEVDREMLKDLAQWTPYNDEIDGIYEGALIAYAAKLGVRYVPFAPKVKPGIDPGELRQLASDCVRAGRFEASPPIVQVTDQRSLFYRPANVARFDQGGPFGSNLFYQLPWGLHRQCEVEVIRRDRSSPAERAFWEPILTKVEAVIARWPDAVDASGATDFLKVAKLDSEIDGIYSGAIKDYATRLGLVVVTPPPPVPTAPAKGMPVFFDVKLTTTSGQGVILLASWLDWRIATLKGNGAADLVFERIAPGTIKKVLGVYAYKIINLPGHDDQVGRVEFDAAGSRVLP